MSDRPITDEFPPEHLHQQVKDLRREMVAQKMQLLELQDKLQIAATDHGDAVALLGQAELLLEEKINYILNLDQTLNLRIRELEQECDRKSEEIERRGDRIAELTGEMERHHSESAAIIKDLGERLELANQEVGKAHNLARDLDQQRAATVTELAREQDQHSATRRELDAQSASLRTSQQHAADLQSQVDSLERQLAENQQALADTNAQLAKTSGLRDNAESRLKTIFSSALWKISRPWRALFGPKV